MARGRRRQPGANDNARNHLAENGSSEGRKGGSVPDTSTERGLVAVSLVDYAFMASVVFGGCCSNVWTYEELLHMEPLVGPALTFSQMAFITVQKLPSFLDWRRQNVFPRLKPRHVPLRQWILQVLVFASSSLLNNLVYAYNVPLPIQIVFRSAGLAVSMMFGRFLMGKRYSLQQICSVTLVSVGVVLATLSRPTSPKSTTSTDNIRYTIGIGMLALSLVLTGILGMLQERTYAKYGPHWQEGVFYTHVLSLPMFAFMIPQVKQGLGGLAIATTDKPSTAATLVAFLVLAGNLVSQLICISAVNKLNSRVSSVSTQVVLTARKALSLCVSVWWFRNGWNLQLAAGASMVFVGSSWYALCPSVDTTRAADRRTEHIRDKKAQ